MTTISKTEALSAATGCVSKAIRNSSTSYTVYGPYYDEDWDGRRTEVHVGSYAKAVALRHRWVAHIALLMLGQPGAAEWIGADDGTSAEQVARAITRERQA